MLGSVVSTQREFMEKVQELVQKEGLTYIDAIVHCCSVMNIEIDTAAKLLGKAEKEIIKEEAIKLNLLKDDRDETSG